MSPYVIAVASYLAGVASTIAIEFAKTAFSKGEKRLEAVRHMLALRGKLIVCLGNDNVGTLDHEMKQLSQWSGHFAPTDRLSADMLTMQHIYSYAQQDWSEWNDDRMGERRRQIADYTQALEDKERDHKEEWYVGRRPLFRAK